MEDDGTLVHRDGLEFKRHSPVERTATALSTISRLAHQVSVPLHGA
jgi:hypothetical protein